MELTNYSQIKWNQKYYVVEAMSAYTDDTFTAQTAWTTKEEAIAEKNRTMNLNSDDLRRWLRTRYRHRTLSNIDAQRLFH